jgi:hypothetical protein
MSADGECTSYFEVTSHVSKSAERPVLSSCPKTEHRKRLHRNSGGFLCELIS